MSTHLAYRRQPAPAQYAQSLRPITIPAPTRGIIMDENQAFMQPGGCAISDNWFPTMRGVKLRGGCIRWCDIHALDAPAWANSTVYAINDQRYDGSNGTIWKCLVAHTSPAAPTTFAQDRVANPTRWQAVTFTRLPIISGFEYVVGTTQKMFAGNATKLVDVSASMPVLVKSGQASGNYAAAQFATATGNFMLVVNDAGDPVLRFNGSSWTVLDPASITAWANNTAYAVGALAKDTSDSTYWRCLVAHTSPVSGTFLAARTANPTFWTNTAADGVTWITGPAGRNVEFGRNLTYVWKYRNRLFFIESNSMSAWYLPLNAVGGVLQEIPLSGAAMKGGKLLFGATWSIDAGDGIDDKCVFVTDQGEVMIFTGSDPGNAGTAATGTPGWHQEGLYNVSPPMGMNAWTNIGGDLVIMTVDGIVPISMAITKSAGQLELAMLTRTIKPMWRDEVLAKRAWSWTIKKWDEYGGIFVTWPGGEVGNRYCAAANDATGAWCRALGWDATCFMLMRGDMFFGTQSGIVMQADRTGYDDGVPYVATLVGGWETFQAPTQQNVWHQARAMFTSNQAFLPQLSAAVDYVVTVPSPPPPIPDPGVQEVWDQGLWDVARWDQPSTARPPVRATGWISIGKTGFAHAPIVQVTVAQQARPDVELIAISATFEPAGVNV